MTTLHNYNDFNIDLAKTVVGIIALDEAYRTRANRNTRSSSRKSRPTGALSKLKGNLGLGIGKFLGGVVNQVRRGGMEQLQDILNQHAPEAWAKISSKTLDKKDLQELADIFQSVIKKLDDSEVDKIKDGLEKMADVIEDAGEDAGLKIKIEL